MGQRRSDDGSNLELAADELVLRSRAFDALLSYANDGAAHPGKLGPSVFVIECREPIHSFIHSFVAAAVLQYPRCRGEKRVMFAAPKSIRHYSCAGKRMPQLQGRLASSMRQMFEWIASQGNRESQIPAPSASGEVL